MDRIKSERDNLKAKLDAKEADLTNMTNDRNSWKKKAEESESELIQAKSEADALKNKTNQLVEQWNNHKKNK